MGVIKELFNLEEHANKATYSLCSEKFEGIIVRKQDLSYTDFSNCDFRNVLFDDCTFSESSFTLSRLIDVEFKSCDLDNASFSNSTISGGEIFACSMNNTNLNGVRCYKKVVLSCCTGSQTNFNFADLYHVEIEHCSFEDADFRFAILEGAKLTNTKLGGCRVNDLTNVLNISIDEESDLTGTNLDQARNWKESSLLLGPANYEETNKRAYLYSSSDFMKL